MRQIKTRWRGVVFLGVVAAASLPSAPARAVVPECEVTGCGSNTPVLFGTPIIGLNLDGVPNDVGVALAPKLVRVQDQPWWRAGTDCPAGAVLGIEKGALVGKLQGQIACRGDALLGLAFKLSVPCKLEKRAQCPPAPIEVEIRISEASSVWTWRRDNPAQVPSYRLAWHRLPAHWVEWEPQARVGDSICPRRESWMEEEQLWPLKDRLPPDRRRRYEQWGLATDHLVVVQGETYRNDASIDPARVGPSWFNISCVGTAIAKMRLLGYDPMEALSQGGPERASTLKMLTARYYNAQSYTTAGVPLMWKHRAGVQFEGDPAPDTWTSKVVESYWGAKGALCLTHRRTWRKQSSLAGAAALLPWALTMPEALPAEVYAVAEPSVVFAIRRAPGLLDCSALVAPPSGYFWVTYPVHHVSHQ